MHQSVKTGTFENEAGDRILLNYHTAESRQYETAGYKLVSNSDDITAAAMTAASVLTTESPLEGTASEMAHSKDPEDAPADPSAVAYPAGQLPGEVPAGNHDVEPISNRTMQDSQPQGDGGTVPLTDAYVTPPTEGRNPSPETRAAQREANASEGIVDPRAAHEANPERVSTGAGSTGSTGDNTQTDHVKSDKAPTDAVDSEKAKGDEGSSGAASATTAGGAPVPADLTATEVVDKSQGANKNAESQGTARPTARSRNRS